MTPKEFRNAIDDEWPVEIRFIVEQIIQAWESESVERDNLLRRMKDEMNSGWWNRLRARGWKELTDQAGSLDLSEGRDQLSAEEENHEEEARHAETDRQDQQGASS
jgi:hypothetical protein